MSIKCIALDLDGTTLSSASTISDGNRRAIERAIDRDICVVVASGRPLTSLPDCVMDIPGIRYTVTINGTAVHQLIPEKKCIHRIRIGEDQVREILDIVGDRKVVLETFLNDQAYCSAVYKQDPGKYGVKPGYYDYIRTTRIPVDDMRGFLLCHISEISNIDLVTGDADMRKELIEALEKARTDFYMTSSVINRIEMSGKNAGKAAGLQFLQKKLGIAPEETAAFGNADNDIDMIRASGYGIAVADASENCRLAADYVTKECRQDGVAWAFEHILHI